MTILFALTIFFGTILIVSTVWVVLSIETNYTSMKENPNQLSSIREYEDQK